LLAFAGDRVRPADDGDPLPGHRVLDAIAQSLPIALGLLLATAPMLIPAMVLVTKRPPMIAGAFVGGWLLGLTVVGAVVIAVADLIDLTGQRPAWATGLKITLGLLLIGLAVRKWRGRPRPGDEPKVPSWVAAAEAMSGRRAFGLAFLLASVNPKNLLLMISGATVIADATSRPGEQIVALLVFVLVASLGVAAPTILSLVLGTRSGPVLARIDAWMTAHNASLISVVLLVLGVVVVANGIGTL
jgi:threonine/homoserine/homoserine lactone efflux protein